MIITFYSYKGGVGRSMALANVAELLRQAGLRVLMVDWDLEAPGLERYFPSLDLDETLQKPGVMDLLLRYKDQIASEPLPGTQFLLAPPTDCLLTVPPFTSDHARLMLLTAGQRHGSQLTDYVRSVLSFDWQDFYEHWEGETYFEWLRQQFDAMADVTLIDSRTGVTEMGGVCTYQLADTVVLFCTANHQSINGTLEMARSLTASTVRELRRQRPLSVLIVPARVEDRAETTLLNQFQEQFDKLFASFVPQSPWRPSGLFWKLKIPHVPYYAFTELVAVRETGTARAEDLVEAFTSLARVLILGDLQLVRDNVARIRTRLQQMAEDNARQDNHDQTQEFLTSNQALADWQERGMPGLPPIDLRRWALLDLLPQDSVGPDIRQDRRDVEQLRRRARTAQEQGDQSEALALWRQLLTRAPDDREATDELQVYNSLETERLQRLMSELRAKTRSSRLSELDEALKLAQELWLSHAMDDKLRAELDDLTRAAIENQYMLKKQSARLRGLMVALDFEQAITMTKAFVDQDIMEIEDQDGRLTSTIELLERLLLEYAGFCTRKTEECIARAEQMMPYSPQEAAILLDDAEKTLSAATPETKARLEQMRSHINGQLMRWEKAQALMAEADHAGDPVQALLLLHKAQTIYPATPGLDDQLARAKSAAHDYIQEAVARNEWEHAIDQTQFLSQQGSLDLLDRETKPISPSTLLAELRDRYSQFCNRQINDSIAWADILSTRSPRAAMVHLNEARERFPSADAETTMALYRALDQTADMLDRSRHAEAIIMKAAQERDPIRRLSLLFEAGDLFPGIEGLTHRLAQTRLEAAHVLSQKTQQLRRQAFELEASADYSAAVALLLPLRDEVRLVLGTSSDFDEQLAEMDAHIERLNHAAIFKSQLEQATQQLEDAVQRQNLDAASRILSALAPDVRDHPRIVALADHLSLTPFTRPSLIIGLGGAGQQFLSLLKADLFSSNFGRIPDGVELFCLDTARQVSERTAPGTLEPGHEFIRLSGNLATLVRDIAMQEGRFPHLSPWFRAKFFLDNFPPAILSAESGAARIRQLGRLALFNDLVPRSRSAVRSRLDAALSRLRSRTALGSPLQVIIVGSLTGATSSAIFIDIAFLLRQLVRDNDVILRAILTLPGARSMDQIELRANAFAAWRELNRFMLATPDHPIPSPVYDPSDRNLNAVPGTRPFDQCFLIEDSPTALPDAVIATAAMLDVRAGSAFFAHAQSPTTPLFSTFGGSVIEVPAYRVHQSATVDLALAFLGRLFDETSESPAQPISVAASQFLSNPAQERSDGNPIPSTPFMSTIADLIYRDADQNLGLQENWALHGPFKRFASDRLDWWTSFTELGSRQELETRQQDIRDTVARTIFDTIQPSDVAGDTPKEAIPRLRDQIDRFQEEFLGSSLPNGTSTQGTLGNTLAFCCVTHTSIFREILDAWIVHTLVGSTSNVRGAKAGKPKYVLGFLRELHTIVERFNVFMRKVANIRASEGVVANANRQMVLREQGYVEQSERRGLMSILSRAPYSAQRAYLDAAQVFINARMTDMLNTTVIETTDNFLGIISARLTSFTALCSRLYFSDRSIRTQLEYDRLNLQAPAGDRDSSLSHRFEFRFSDESQCVDEDALERAFNALHWQISQSQQELTVSALLIPNVTEPDGGFLLDDRTRLLSFFRSLIPPVPDLTQNLTYDDGTMKFRDLIENAWKSAEPTTRLLGSANVHVNWLIFGPGKTAESVGKTLDTGNFLGRHVQSQDPFRITIIRFKDLIQPDAFAIWHECTGDYFASKRNSSIELPLHVFSAELAANNYERRLTPDSLRAFNPRVVALLEHSGRLKLFLTALALDLIKVKVLTSGFRRDYEYWLPDAVEEQAHCFHRSEGHPDSDIFDVLQSFIFSDLDAVSKPTKPIDYAGLQRVCDNAEHASDPATVAQRIRREADSDSASGFVLALQNRSRELNSAEHGLGQPYQDLADLASLILRDMMAERDAQTTPDLK